MPINNEEAKTGYRGIQMPQAWGWDSQEISLLWVKLHSSSSSISQVFLLDSCPRLQTPSVSQRNHGRNRIFRDTASCLSPWQSCLIPLYYSSKKKKNHWNIYLPLKIKKKKRKKIFKRYREKGPFTMTFRAKREKRHLTDH